MAAATSATLKACEAELNRMRTEREQHTTREMDLSAAFHNCVKTHSAAASRLVAHQREALAASRPSAKKEVLSVTHLAGAVGVGFVIGMLAGKGGK